MKEWLELWLMLMAIFIAIPVLWVEWDWFIRPWFVRKGLLKKKEPYYHSGGY